MAQPSNLYDTYDTTGIREDLVDIIYNISPSETPILSAIPRTAAKSTNHFTAAFIPVASVTLRS